MDTQLLLGIIALFLVCFLLFSIIVFKKYFPSKNTSELQNTQKILSALWKIQQLILESLEFKEVVQKVANAVLMELGKYGYIIIVLSLKDEEKGILKRISISETEEARKALQFAPIPFSKIEIPLSATENIAIRALNENKELTTNKLSDLLVPLIPTDLSDKAQASAGIKASTVLPVHTKTASEAIGVLIFSINKEADMISTYEKEIMRGFADAVGIAIQNAKLYTSLEETKKKLEFANTRLKELDKLKDDFVSVASHELRTPMTAIKSYIWMALNKYGAIPIRSSTDTKSAKLKYKLPEDLQKYMSRAYISVERLINLVNDMLNISRIESGRIALRLTQTDIIQLAHEVKDEVLTKAAEKNITINIKTNLVHRVLADRDKIHEVYLNLIGNSLKFTPSGGTITISFSEKESFVYTSITDTGTGIDKKDLPRLFSKFGRLDDSYVATAESGGTGLGLFITKSLIDIHKGTISAQSQGTGQGSTFTFSLPIAGTIAAQNLKKNAPQETTDTKELEKTSINFV